MSKKNAFLIHLGFSLIVFIILLLMIIYVWYPAPYFDAAYRMKWIKVIAFVDLVIGPGLTLIIYKPNKPTLKLDMSVILFLQLSALSWGVYNVWSVHPKMNVYFDGQISCFDQTEISESGANPDLASSPMPDRLVAVLPYPQTVEEKLSYLNIGSEEIHMVYRLGHLFKEATTEITSQLGEDQADIMEIVNKSEDNRKIWNRFIAGHSGVSRDWRYFSFYCFKDKQMLVLDIKNNKVEAVLDIELPLDWAINSY